MARYHVLGMERERFEELVRRALATLPGEIADRIDNVDVRVDNGVVRVTAVPKP